MNQFFERLRSLAVIGSWVFIVSMTLSVHCFAQEAAETSADDGSELVEGLPPEVLAWQQEWESIDWQEGPVTGQIGTMGQLEIPEGYRFTGAAGAQKLLELYGNPPDNSILAAVIPTAEDQDWTLIFEFDDIGYVKDDDKDSLDPESLIEDFRSSIPRQNEVRRQYNLAEVTGMSWSVRPFYDSRTNNLTWGLKMDTTDGSTINYDIRVLGRRGVMKVTLLDSPATFQKSVPVVDELLTGYSFTDGNKYAEWQAGDKVAAYGLTGLVAGGAAVAAAKTGLLAKLGALLAKGGKLLIVGVIAIFVAIKSFFGRLFGRSEESDQMSA